MKKKEMQTMDVSLFEKENQKKTNSVKKQEVSRSWMESERSEKFEEGNIKRAHKTS